MIETKLFEIRDAMTFIPVMATRMVAVQTRRCDYHEKDSEEYLLNRCGYLGTELVRLTKLQGDEWYDEPHRWGCDRPCRTMTFAHEYIRDNWDDLVSGQVIDVEYLRGETDKSKRSERFE